VSSTAERLNNAIVTLDFRAQLDPSISRGVKKAVAELATSWVNYWNSADRRIELMPIARVPKLQRYAAWYGRAWALMPEALRAALAHPETLDATVWAGIEDNVQFVAEGGQATAIAAKKLATEVATAAGKGVSSLLSPALVVIAVLLAYGWARRS
jgi:hypothetical protein